MLFRLAVFSAPHRTAIEVFGVLAIATAALLLWRLEPQVCEPGAWCATPAVRITTTISLLIGMVLLIAGYIYV